MESDTDRVKRMKFEIVLHERSLCECDSPTGCFILQNQMKQQLQREYYDKAKVVY